MTRARLAFLALALATIAIGLLVHRGDVVSHAATRDVLGDALWAMMIAWGLGALAPAARPWARGGVALAVCTLVELSQRVQVPWLDAVRATTIGHLALGSDWDARDLAAYAAGVLAAVLLELAFARRDPDPGGQTPRL